MIGHPTSLVDTAQEAPSTRTLGAVALIGGSEHRDVTRPIDRWLMEHTGTSRVRVVVVPVASSGRRMPSTAALARTYWTSLGAAVSFVVPDPRRPVSSFSALDDPDIVVLTGGVPNRVIRSLGMSPLWDRILELWRSGTALSGSSAGSMALFDWRLRLVPPRPFELIPGLGPLSGYVALPHFDRYVADRPRHRALLDHVAHGFHGQGIVGLDEGTALVGWDDDYRVVGRGAVTLHDGRWTTYPSGSVVAVRLLPTTPDEPRPDRVPVAVAA
ncbi:MAG TPA: Type 1 glutamine amidotransferase-like domain-containing protein [Nitriliruptorales bacterium]|nr:Type 1 glutamine amidotransferase-like domain-containing protein [Nitriliruptorales bacterium]